MQKCEIISCRVPPHNIIQYNIQRLNFLQKVFAPLVPRISSVRRPPPCLDICAVTFAPPTFAPPTFAPPTFAPTTFAPPTFAPGYKDKKIQLKRVSEIKTRLKLRTRLRA